MTSPGFYTFRSYDPTQLKHTYSPNDTTGVVKDYYLPPVTGQDKRTLRINRSGTATIEMEHTAGSFVNTGTAMAYPSSADITATFDFLPSWVSPMSGIDPNIYNQNKNYGLGIVGLENAIDDFFVYVVEAGLGTLVETLPQGAKFAYRYTSALIASDVNVTRLPGARATVDIIFNCPSGIWTYSDGSTQIHIR